MRNMKSLLIFLFIVIKREEKFQGSLWENERPQTTLEYEKPRVKCNPKVILEFYICNFLNREKGWNFSSHTFCWSVNESRLFSSFSLVHWVVSCELWKNLLVLFHIVHSHMQTIFLWCGLLWMYTCVANYFLQHVKFGAIVKLTIRCFLTIRLFGA